jgi:Ca-activated chloride channel family protein
MNGINWSWFTSFHHGFAYPAALWLMVVLLLLSLADLVVRRSRRRALAWLGSLPVLRTLVAEQALLRRLRGSCAALALSLLVTGIAGPQWGRDWEQPAAPGRDLVVVLDLSRSMLAEAPSRLERAKAALLDLADTVQRRGGHRLALVVFGGRARVVCPLTHDYDHFRDALGQLAANDPPPDLAPAADAPSGTRIGEALVLALQLRDVRYAAAQDLLLLSDGDDPAHDDEWRSGAEEARDQHVPVHVVGIGGTQPSPIPLQDGYQLYRGQPVTTRLDEKPLREIARLTEGTYTAEHDGPLALGRLFRERIEPRGAREDSDDNLPVYRQRFAWFLGPALALFALEMALGWPAWNFRRRPRPGLRPAVAGAALVLMAAASAGTPEDLVRQGNASYQRDDFGGAVEKYAAAEDRITDPGLVAFNEAAALYRQAGQLESTPRRTGLYREAELHYRRCLEDAQGPRRAEALYGLGNSLLQQAATRGAEACQEAARAYDLCLAVEGTAPDLAADARHNLELAKLLGLQAKNHKKERNSEQEDDDADPSRPRPNRPDRGDGGPAELQTGTPGAAGERVRAQLQPGQQPIKTDEPRPPGEGNLPPVEDRDQLVPMAPEDAAGHLERAVARVLRERREHQHLTARPPSANVKDW